MSVPITSADCMADASNCQSTENCSPTTRQNCSSEAAYISSRTVPDKDINVPEVCSPTTIIAQDCDSRDVSALPDGDLTVNVDKTEVAENISCSAKTSENCVHFHSSDNDLLDSSANVEPTESKRQNLDSDRIPDGDSGHHRSADQNPLVPSNSGFQTVDESASAVCKVESYDDNAKPHSSETAVNRKRRVSAVRSALYRRLLSSENAGSSDVDVSSDIFDLQSLSSSDDDDGNSDISDLNLDGSSDRSYLVIFFYFLKKNSNTRN